LPNTNGTERWQVQCPLSRRAKSSASLGFAALAAAPVRALGPVRRPARWYNWLGQDRLIDQRVQRQRRRGGRPGRHGKAQKAGEDEIGPGLAHRRQVREAAPAPIPRDRQGAHLALTQGGIARGGIDENQVDPPRHHPEQRAGHLG
jgi:hypothetical protein